MACGLEGEQLTLYFAKVVRSCNDFLTAVAALLQTDPHRGNQAKHVGCQLRERVFGENGDMVLYEVCVPKRQRANGAKGAGVKCTVGIKCESHRQILGNGDQAELRLPSHMVRRKWRVLVCLYEAKASHFFD